MDTWIERELAAATLPDERLKARLGRLLDDLGRRIGRTVPAACQDWAATKAAYRFFDNPGVTDGDILDGHFAPTADRFAATTGTILVLHDTTEFSFQRSTPRTIGSISYVKGEHVTHTVCGVLLHSSSALTSDGLPLGLAAAKFWTRKAFKGTNAAKRTINPTTVSIEEKESYRWLENLTAATGRLGDPGRCVRAGDREGCRTRRPRSSCPAASPSASRCRPTRPTSVGWSPRCGARRADPRDDRRDLLGRRAAGRPQGHRRLILTPSVRS